MPSTSSSAERSPQPSSRSPEDPGGSLRALVVVCLTVFLCTPIWFTGTAVAPALEALWDLEPAHSAWLTISVQLGFIAGTFFFALFNLSDIFNARRVFLWSAVLGALCNLGFAYISSDLSSAILFRFLSGLTLAGIYPVGMKIIATWFRSGLGWRLGWLVGALTLGKAYSYLMRGLAREWDWQTIVASASVVSVLGGVLMVVAIGDGPYLKSRVLFNARMCFQVFHDRGFRDAAVGYFGHMWELYAFWSLGYFYLAARFQDTSWADSVSLLTFLSFLAGAAGCVVGGLASKRIGEKRVALISLLVSASCCLLAGSVFQAPGPVVLGFFLVWGFFVVSDSAQFSSLAAQLCPPAYTGTALTVQTGVGFAITIFSIQLLSLLADSVGWQWVFTLLAVGPLVGSLYTLRIPDVVSSPARSSASE